MSSPSSPLPSSSSTPSSTSQTVYKPSLFQLLGFAVQIVGQFFPMVYPIFAYYILTSFLIPEVPFNAEKPFENPTLWVVFIGIFLIMFLFKAGWNAVMFEASQQWLKNLGFLKPSTNSLQVPSDEPRRSAPTFFESFSILGHFIPGLGTYGLDYLIGCVLEVILLALPLVLMGGLAYALNGIPQQYIDTIVPLFQKAFETGEQVDQAQAISVVNALPDAELIRIGSWTGLLLLGLMGTLIVQIGILFWEPIVRRDGCNAFKAFVRSAKVVGKHPFSAFGIWLYFNTSFLLLGLFMNANEFLAVVGSFMNILFIALMGCYLFLFMHFYVGSADPSLSPHPVTPESSNAN
jgi:hypothetical protein